jgi:Flp pilus assembly protein TadD
MSTVLSAALVVVVLAVYWPVRDHGAIPFDDPSYVTENEQVLAGLSWSGVLWAFASVHAHNWHPLTWLSHMLDVELHGLDLGGHHLDSVALHGGAAALLLAFLARATGALWPSFGVAALFALHPLRVESVAWLAERKDVLSAFLFALTLLLWTTYAKRAEPREGRPWYIASLAAYAAGLLAKPMLVSLPVVLLLLDVWPLRRLRGVLGAGGGGEVGSGSGRVALAPRALLMEKAPFFLLAMLVAGGTLVAQQRVVKSLDSHPLDERVVTAITSCWVYLGKLAWPRDLAIFYPYDAGRWRPSVVVALGLGLAAATALAASLARRHGYVFVGWLWYLATLAPVLGLVQVGLQARADRYTYLPSIGVLIAVVFGLREAGRRLLPGESARRAAAAVLLLVPCVLLAGATRAQLALWRDPATLYAHAAAVTTDNAWAHHNAAQVLLRRGDDVGAARHFEEVARIDPSDVDALRNLGAIAARAGRFAAAAAIHRRAAAAAPGDPRVHRDLGEALLAAGELEPAAEVLERAGSLRADDAEVWYLLGTVRVQQDRVAEGEALLHRAVALDPGHAGVHNALGVIAARRGDRAEAARRFEEALRLEPGYSEARRNLDLLAAYGSGTGGSAARRSG